MLLTPIVDQGHITGQHLVFLIVASVQAGGELGAEDLGRSGIRKFSTAYAVQRIFLEWLTIRLGVILIYGII